MKKIGILGGGQLGLMSYQAGLDLNFGLGFLDPDPLSPCSWLPNFEVGDLQDEQRVVEFGRNFDIVTIEIEKVSVSGLQKLVEMGTKVYPSPSCIAVIQDKIRQKQFFAQHAFETAPFVVTQNTTHLQQFEDWFPAVHKLARDGYDGRGVRILHNWEQGFDAPAVLEQKVDIDKELSVIVARNPEGQMRSFPVVEQVFHGEGHMLDYLLAPAQIDALVALQAQQTAERLTAELGVVGLLAVEFFYTRQGQLWVNEVAPRPHNSGHHTIEANYTSQFQQFLRAVADLPPGSTDMKVPFAAVVNLLGEQGQSGKVHYQGLEKILAMDGVFPHLYGKVETKPLRKMGHTTILAHSHSELIDKIERVKRTFKALTL